MDDGRLLDVGQVVSDGKLEVTGVSYQEAEDGTRHTFEYHIRHKDQLDAERLVEAERLEEAARVARAAVEVDPAHSDRTPAASLTD